MTVEETIHNLRSEAMVARTDPVLFGEFLAKMEEALRGENNKLIEDYDGLRLVNIPRGEHDPGKRVIGFCIDQAEIPVMGLFSEQLEQYCALLLSSRGYKVEKK